MRSRITAPAVLLFVASGFATWVAACSHDLDAFISVGPDSSPVDTGGDAVDSGTVDAVDSTIDSRVDSAIDTRDSSTTEVETDAPEETATDAPEETATDADADTGPPLVKISCTGAGPAGMICIEGATFSLGATNKGCGMSGCASETPPVSVATSRFFIDEHEVTVGRFRTWWNSGRVWPTNSTTIFTTGATVYKWRNTWPGAPTAPATSSGCNWRGATDASNDDKPLNCVDWYTALGMCIAETKRLPTEAEWELVASGGENRLYPWSAPNSEDDAPMGSDVTCDHALASSGCLPGVAARESTVWGRSVWGPWNMAGSLAEWTIDGYAANHSAVPAAAVDPVTEMVTNAARSTRGGGYLATPGAMRAAARISSGLAATTQDGQIGFRCAKR